jgi:hypothetical protein
MSVAQVPAQWTAERLIAAVKQLPPTELRKFKRRFTEWQQDRKRSDEEAELLKHIEENSCLPIPMQRRFNFLRRKRQAETLTETEEVELQTLWQWVEQMNTTRLAALTKLAHKRGVHVKTLMHELGLARRLDVF